MRSINKNVIVMLGVATALFVIGLFLSNTVFAQEPSFCTGADNQPEFKSGYPRLVHLLNDSLRYQQTKHMNGSGFVLFIIEKNGRRGDGEVIKGIGDDYDREHCASFIQCAGPVIGPR